jgi:hypothetical protein
MDRGEPVMPDSGQSRHMDDQAIGDSGAAESGLVWQPERISQADTLRDLAFAAAGSLSVALLANLLALAF